LPRFLSQTVIDDYMCVHHSTHTVKAESTDWEHITSWKGVHGCAVCSICWNSHIHRVWIREYFHILFCFQHHSFCLNRTKETGNVKSYQTNTHINNLWTYEFWCMSQLSVYFARKPSIMLDFLLIFLPIKIQGASLIWVEIKLWKHLTVG
jgi:hypothetical protein